MSPPHPPPHRTPEVAVPQGGSWRSVAAAALFAFALTVGACAVGDPGSGDLSDRAPATYGVENLSGGCELIDTASLRRWSADEPDRADTTIVNEYLERHGCRLTANPAPGDPVRGVGLAVTAYLGGDDRGGEYHAVKEEQLADPSRWSASGPVPGLGEDAYFVLSDTRSDPAGHQLYYHLGLRDDNLHLAVTISVYYAQPGDEPADAAEAQRIGADSAHRALNLLRR